MSALVLLLLSSAAFLELNPQPQEAYITERRLFTLDRGLPIVVEDHASEDDLAPLEAIYEALGLTPSILPASRFKVGSRAIYVGEADRNPAFKHRSLRRYVPDAARVGAGAYHLYIWRDGILVAGADRSGLVHGIQTLAQIIESSKAAGVNRRGVPAVPHVEIRDYPDIAIRAACLRGAPTSAQIRALARLKCNMLIFESDDFYGLTEESVIAWRRAFREARTAGMTPVPLFDIFRAPNSLLRAHPAAVEGRSRIDRMTLTSDDWTALGKRNIILTAENPLRVTVGNTPVHFRQDYLLSEGGIEAPFIEDYAHPWMIRRMPGGAIPSGATVTLTYSYAPPNTNVLCPNAPETRALVRSALETLVRELAPEYIHAGFGDVPRLNQDLRCRDIGGNNAVTFAAAVNLITGIAATVNPDLRVLLWADALLPQTDQADSDGTSTVGALDLLKGNPLLIPRLDRLDSRNASRSDAVIHWLARQDMPVVIALNGDVPDAYALNRRLGAHSKGTTGIVVLDADPFHDATRIALAKAWSLETPYLVWPEILNEYFGVALWAPTLDAIREVLIDYIERRILTGVSPRELRDDFDRFLDDRKRQIPRDDAGLRATQGLLEQLTRYLEQEQNYSAGNTRNAFRDLAQTVRRYGDLDITVDPERIDRIVATIQEQQLFVPASILLGRPMAYYRPHRLPVGALPYEAPAHITYVDVQGKAEATLDLLAQCGPVFRVDFETVHAAAVHLYASEDGLSFDLLETLPRRPGDLIRGPFLLSKPTRSRYIRVSVEASGEQAVLREVRAFVLKPPMRASCPTIAGGSENDVVWPDSDRVVGLLRNDNTRLAAAPTEIRLARNREFLFIGIMAQDPMPHAMGAVMTDRDAALWEEESVEIRIRPGNRPARRFLVNPLGTRHDGMNVAANLNQWDAGWDADWRVRTEQTTTGWTATLMLPFSILGGAPESGDMWHANFLRHRNNVEQETSVWAIDPAGAKMYYGVIHFD